MSFPDCQDLGLKGIRTARQEKPWLRSRRNRQAVECQLPVPSEGDCKSQQPLTRAEASGVTATLGRPLPAAQAKNYNSQKAKTDYSTHSRTEELTLATCWSFRKTTLRTEPPPPLRFIMRKRGTTTPGVLRGNT
ncbi:hypothetical protein HispidOSU_030672 [Sigmodon hispidus]